MIRILAGIVILLLSTLVNPVVLLPIALLHALAWFAVELIIIGAFVDFYFGVSHVVPWYTVSAIVIVFCAEWIKPHLSFYNQS